MANKSSNKPLAAIYAQALYEAAAEAHLLEQVTAELAELKAILHKDAKIGAFLDSPTIDFGSKRKVTDDAFKNHTKITRNFLLVIAQHGRSPMLDQIVDAFTDYSNKKANIAVVEVQSARSLEEDERTKLRALLQNKLNKKINLDERVNPELMGGLIVTHEDTMWDGSLRHKLDEILTRMEAPLVSTARWLEN
jgi:F-type H+-transporting ATPase subunit delta